MNKPLAAQLGRICQYIYPPHNDQFLTPDSPIVTIIQDKSKNPTSTAGILRYADKTVLVFQGTLTGHTTQAVKDWLENFKLVQVSAPRLPGKVHEGFAGQLNLILEDVVDDLQSGFTPPLYLTGHSQGGAVAVLATKALQVKGINVAATYTFASPRPGNSTFVASLQTPVFRLEFGDDIVPHVAIHAYALGVLQKAANTIPELKSVLAKANILDTLGYVSAGTLTYGAPEQDLHINVSAVEEKLLLAKRTMQLLKAKSNIYNHHYMSNYIKMLT